MKIFLKSILNFVLNPFLSRLKNKNLESLDKSIILNAKKLINSQKNLSGAINEYEFSAFSQWGEDGIINFLIQNLDIKSKIFIEFGVENYLESNTRFLLINRNWSGLIFDMSKENISEIKKHYYYWRHDLRAEIATITAENINDLIEKNGFKKPIGLLSIDIDGNDYWVWKNLEILDPEIVVIEYNYRFGSKKSLTIPYDPGFDRRKAHSSMVYYGASLKALVKLAEKKDMKLVATNLAGNNAFFVKEKLLNNIVKEVKISECFREGKFREARDLKGQLLYLSKEEEIKIFQEMDVEEV
jgi:hypothetical protein